MSDSELSIRDLLLQEPSVDRFIISLVEQAPSVYGNAYSRSYAEQAYDKPEAAYTFGHNRRGGFEAMLRREAVRAGLLATTEYTERTHTPYVMVRAGRFLLTESHVQCAGEVPTAARFREQNAAVNALLMRGSLPFAEFDPLKLYELSEANGIYGIISHGAHTENAKAPSFMHLVFPSEDCTRLVETIDLFALRLEMLARANKIAETEIAVDVALPKVKRKGEGQ